MLHSTRYALGWAGSAALGACLQHPGVSFAWLDGVADLLARVSFPIIAHSVSFGNNTVNLELYNMKCALPWQSEPHVLSRNSVASKVSGKTLRHHKFGATMV